MDEFQNLVEDVSIPNDLEPRYFAKCYICAKHFTNIEEIERHKPSHNRYVIDAHFYCWNYIL